jgi:hypothetical protein
VIALGSSIVESLSGTQPARLCAREIASNRAIGVLRLPSQAFATKALDCRKGALENIKKEPPHFATAL